MEQILADNISGITQALRVTVLPGFAWWAEGRQNRRVLFRLHATAAHRKYPHNVNNAGMFVLPPQTRLCMWDAGIPDCTYSICRACR